MAWFEWKDELVLLLTIVLIIVFDFAIQLFRQQGPMLVN